MACAHRHRAAQLYIDKLSIIVRGRHVATGRGLRAAAPNLCFTPKPNEAF